MGIEHFSERAVERFGVTDPKRLFIDLRKALSNLDRWADYIEPVVGNYNGGAFYRIRLAESQEIAYVAARNGHPLTIYTQAQIMEYKATKKGKIRRARVNRESRELA